MDLQSVLAGYETFMTWPFPAAALRRRYAEGDGGFPLVDIGPQPGDG
jgi:hypothetical protein